MFVCTYGFGKKTQGSPAMFRGIFVEDAVVDVLTQKKSIEQATKDAQKNLMNDTSFTMSWANVKRSTKS